MPRILVIDDEKSIRNTLREILQYEKYEVDDVANGPDGLRFLESNKYNAILCDIKMPGMDGIEVLEKILLMVDTPVIMISGMGPLIQLLKPSRKGHSITFQSLWI